MSKYKDIYDRFTRSGLGQKAFAAQDGMSAGMISYYLRRARQEEEQLSGHFLPIETRKSVEADQVIRITTSEGLQTTIPV